MNDPHPDLTRAMVESYRRAYNEASYRAPWFADMLNERYGLDTALYLVGSDAPSKGFVNLYDRKRLDLTVEALILLPPWCKLFSEEILAKAYKRLSEYQYKFPNESWEPGTVKNLLVDAATPSANGLRVDPPYRASITIDRIVRDTDLSKKVKILHGYKCQICGLAISLGGGRLYAEAHHIKPLGGEHGGLDIIENILCVCPNHHVMLDYFALCLELPKLRPAAGHDLSAQFIEYHNERVLKA